MNHVTKRLINNLLNQIDALKAEVMTLKSVNGMLEKKLKENKK